MTPLLDAQSRETAWKVAQAINKHDGGVRELPVLVAEKFALEVAGVARLSTSLVYCEVLTGADGGDIRAAAGPVPERDTPEIKAAVEKCQRERLRWRVTARVNAALKKRQADAAAAAGESSTVPAPPAASSAPKSPAAAKTGPTPPSGLPKMQEDVPTAPPVLSGRRVRTDSIKHIRERTVQRGESSFGLTFSTLRFTTISFKVFGTKSGSNTDMLAASAPSTPTAEVESTQLTGMSIRSSIVD